MKSGFITIIGRPNVGKSTLLNAIIGEKISIVSSKPQTTRGKITGIYNRENLQLVFIDTPGVHKPKNKLGEKMIKDVNEAVDGVDCALLVVEPRSPGKTEKELITRFKNDGVPLILVINKTDSVKKDYVAKAIIEYSELADFAAVVPLSALKKDNISPLIDEITKFAHGDTAYYPDDISTDRTERQLVSEILREKLIRRLDDEVPHGINVEIDSLKEREDKPLVEIMATVVCERSSHKGIIIGKNGEGIKKAATAAREEMEKLLGKKVYLECFVKVKEGWRDDEKYIAENEQ